MELKQAVIFAGGRGERLRPLTDHIPKPMASINGSPFLDYLINSLIQSGLNKILILVGYKADKIIERYKDVKNVTIEFSNGRVEDKTGRRVLNAYDKLDHHFLLLYGDNYWPIELKAMCSNYIKFSTDLSTTVFSNKNGTGEYGNENNVVVGKNGFVEKYDKKREIIETNGVDIGYFIVSKKSLDPNLTGNVSFELDILPRFIAKKELSAYITDNQYYFITNMQTLHDFEKAVVAYDFLPLHL